MEVREPREAACWMETEVAAQGSTMHEAWRAGSLGSHPRQKDSSKELR